MEIRVRARGGESLERLASRIERAAAALPGRVRAAMRSEGDAAVAEVRAAWMGVEVSSTRGGGEHSGLRARTAAASRAEAIASGVRILVDSGAVDPRYGAALVKGLNGMGVWSHPVFGTRAMTVQAGQEVFFRTLRGRRWDAPLQRVIDQTIRDIEG